jgi:hypothetical protein
VVDAVHMSAFYKRGFEMARNGFPWNKSPPGFDTTR